MWEFDWHECVLTYLKCHSRVVFLQNELPLIIGKLSSTLENFSQITFKIKWKFWENKFLYHFEKEDYLKILSNKWKKSKFNSQNIIFSQLIIFQIIWRFQAFLAIEMNSMKTIYCQKAFDFDFFDDAFGQMTEFDLESELILLALNACFLSISVSDKSGVSGYSSWT